MKKLIAITVLAALCVGMCGCKKDEVEKPDNEVKTEITEQAVPQPEPEKEPELEEEKDDAVKDIPTLIKELGGESSGDETPFFAEANEFANAVTTRNFELIAEYTGGQSSYYDFLSDVNIKDFTLYPFTFSDSVLEEMMAGWKYPYASAHYFVEFNVTSTELEQFPLGKAVYYMGFTENSAVGNKLCFFVPADVCQIHMFESYIEDKTEEYIEYFIKEFVSDYYTNLIDGRNYPDSFYFYDNVHLITHLMSACGEYASASPYTLEEISDFVTRSFDGNKGVESVDIDYQVWLHDIVLEEIPADDRMFGCSLGHGLAIAEHEVVGIETDGNSRIYTVDVYADYAHFAPASTLVFYFDVNEGQLPKLTLVDLRDNTAREAAVVAV